MVAGEAYLNQVLAFSLGDEGLKLGRGESVNQTSFRHDEKQDLCSGEDGEFVSLERSENKSAINRSGEDVGTVRDATRHGRWGKWKVPSS